MRVSVRELKTHLSKYLHQIQAGGSIIITSHHVEFARLSPIPQNPDEKIQRLLQIEGVHWNGKKPKGGGKNRPILRGKTASDYVIEDRR